MTGNYQPNSSQRPFEERVGDSTPRRVFEEVLRQTAESYSLEEATDPIDLECLREVAARLQGAEFQLAPVLTELVRTALSRQMGPARASDPLFEPMVSRVAEALYNNPESHDRLKALWERLSAVPQ